MVPFAKEITAVSHSGISQKPTQGCLQETIKVLSYFQFIIFPRGSCQGGGLSGVRVFCFFYL